MRLKSLSALLAAAVSAWAIPAAAAPASASPVTQGSPVTPLLAERPAYPGSPRGAAVDNLFGVQVTDPWRWLEDDLRGSARVAEWVAAQNTLTRLIIDRFGTRQTWHAAIEALYQRPVYGVPAQAGGRYFYTRQDPGQQQPVLMVRRTLDGKDRILVDPNLWAADGRQALDDWEPSPDGRHVAISIQNAGSDWRMIRIVRVSDGRMLDEALDWIKFSQISWLDARRFVYSRFPAVTQQDRFTSRNIGQTVQLHRIGTPQSADRQIYATPVTPEMNHSARTTYDGRWIVITSSTGTDDRHEVRLIRNDRLGAPPLVLVAGFRDEWRLVDGVGDHLWFVTSRDAPMLKLVAINMRTRPRAFQTVVAEQTQPLASAAFVGRLLLLTYLKDASSTARMVTLDGRTLASIKLNWIGTAQGFRGRPGDPETFYRFSSFTRPGQIFRFDTASGRTRLFADPGLDYDPDDFVIEQRFFPSKDGTRVPMFIVHRKGLDLSRGAPTLLYGYGGFNVSLTPAFVEARMAWLSAGGVFVMANLRGGGEYGNAWHDAGRLANKQNVFDDFIAAAEYLVAQGITTPKKLAIEGRSNGGLLVTAVLNQRPDLFAAAHAGVPVTDMLRFDRFTAGRYWVYDYGSPGQEADFRNLISYSPYHNVKRGVAYPPVLVTTGDTDDRVVPAHGFKYIARMQQEASGGPHLIRVGASAGHGSGKARAAKITEEADVLAFLAHWTGLEP